MDPKNYVGDHPVIPIVIQSMMSQPLREYIAKRKERENYTTICARKHTLGGETSPSKRSKSSGEAAALLLWASVAYFPELFSSARLDGLTRAH